MGSGIKDSYKKQIRMTSLAFEINWLHVVLKRNNIISNIVQIDTMNNEQQKNIVKKYIRLLIQFSLHLNLLRLSLFL